MSLPEESCFFAKKVYDNSDIFRAVAGAMEKKGLL
jgi:hypothetical protein